MMPKASTLAVRTGTTTAAVHPGDLALAAISVFVLLFLCAPIVVVLPMSFSSASSLEFPPPGLSLRWYQSFLADARWIEALKTSVFVAATASLGALILGSLAAYGLVRGRFPGHRRIELNFAIPMVIPHIVTAIAFYMAFAKVGLLGSLPGLILSHIIIAIPYVVLVMSIAIRSFDERIEQVAFTLGASWPTVFLRVLLPNLLPSLLAAWIFAFVASFDEITVTVFLSGTYETVPKRMFSQLLERIDPTITAVASILIFASMISISVVAILIRPGRLLSRRDSL